VAQVTKATSQSTTYLSRTINVHLLVRPILVRLTIGATGIYKKYVVMLKFDNEFADWPVSLHHNLSDQSCDCL